MSTEEDCSVNAVTLHCIMGEINENYASDKPAVCVDMKCLMTNVHDTVVNLLLKPPEIHVSAQFRPQHWHPSQRRQSLWQALKYVMNWTCEWICICTL